MATPINMMTGENCGTQRKTCSSAILSTTNVTRTGMRLDMALHGYRCLTNCVRHGITFLGCDSTWVCRCVETF